MRTWTRRSALSSRSSPPHRSWKRPGVSSRAAPAPAPPGSCASSVSTPCRRPSSASARAGCWSRAPAARRATTPATTATAAAPMTAAATAGPATASLATAGRATAGAPRATGTSIPGATGSLNPPAFWTPPGTRSRTWPAVPRTPSPTPPIRWGRRPGSSRTRPSTSAIRPRRRRSSSSARPRPRCGAPAPGSGRPWRRTPSWWAPRPWPSASSPAWPFPPRTSRTSGWGRSGTSSWTRRRSSVRRPSTRASRWPRPWWTRSRPRPSTRASAPRTWPRR